MTALSTIVRGRLHRATPGPRVLPQNERCAPSGFAILLYISYHHSHTAIDPLRWQHAPGRIDMPVTRIHFPSLPEVTEYAEIMCVPVIMFKFTTCTRNEIACR